MLAATTGIALVAGAAAAINCLVERTIDARMARTRGRALPLGLITPAETLGLARQLGLTLPPIRLIGIEAGQMEIGAGLSPEVEAALPAVCALIEKFAQENLR